MSPDQHPAPQQDPSAHVDPAGAAASHDPFADDDARNGFPAADRREPGHPSGPPRTGFEPVDGVLGRESEIARLPVTHRAEAFSALHAELERILAQDPTTLPAGLTGSVAGRSAPGPGDASSAPGSTRPTSESDAAPRGESGPVDATGPTAPADGPSAPRGPARPETWSAEDGTR